jgi:hypothetical protein
MSAYNITNPITNKPPITKILTYGVNKNEKTKINPPNKQNPFNEEQIVIEIYSALNQKNYDLLHEILTRLPQGEEITELLFKFIEELQKHNYTKSQLKAISTLLYRLSNIRYASVKLPKEFPNYSQVSIETIKRRELRELQNAQKIDLKIQEIVKNMITHYKLEIKNNKNYNSSNAGRLALKLRDILLSFIIEYTRPESNNTLEDESVFPPDATTENIWSKGVRELFGKKMNNNPPLLLHKNQKNAVLPWQEIRR